MNFTRFVATALVLVSPMFELVRLAFVLVFSNLVKAVLMLKGKTSC